MRSRQVLAVLALATCAACRSPYHKRSGQVELFHTDRSAEMDFADDSRDEELWGVNFVGGEDDRIAAEIGLRGGDFTLDRAGPDDGRHTSYLELHIGMRGYLAPPDALARPFAGAGLVWSGASYDGSDHGYGDYDDEETDDGDAEFWAWLISNAGLYGQIGLEIELGPALVTSGVRFVLSNEADVYSREWNDFAVESFLGIGVCF